MSTQFPGILTTPPRGIMATAATTSHKAQGLTLTPSTIDIGAESDSSIPPLSNLSPTVEQKNSGLLPVIEVRKKSAVAEHTNASPKKKGRKSKKLVKSDSE
jgi:hypothetical protein